ncbi:MAG: PIN domain nuclease [Longimicrobiales bacterium]
MILVDTSAWVEYLRATGSPADRAIRARIEAGEPLALAEPVVMELLAGARDEAHGQRLRRMLLSFDCRPTAGLADWEEAARIYRACRRAGSTVRSLTDCLIAAVALREGFEVLAADRDFDAIARETGLAVVRG